MTQRSDWVAKYQGHSVNNAKKLIAKAKGGAIFVDEAYSLIASKDGDMYGHEVLTTIVEAMTNPNKNVIFIFAGYKNDCQRLFQANSGLRRRFGYTYTFKMPTPSQLADIMKLQCRRQKWRLENSDRIANIIERNSSLFLDAGGSTDKLIHYAKQSVVSRNFPNTPKKIITPEDFQCAIETYKATNDVQDNHSYQHIYL